MAATWLAGPVTVRTVNERPVDTAPDTGEERTGAAAALRQLGHELVARDMPGEELARLRAAVEALTADVATAPVRQNAFANWVALLFDGDAPAHADHPPGEGLMTDSFVSGKTNPMGMAADVHLEGDEAVGRVTLGPAFEGAPGRAHGGLVAALLDETMGLALSVSRAPAFTGRLQIHYRSPTPLGVPLEARARLTRQEGRKLTVTAELREGDTLLAEADGLFLTVDLEHFAERGTRSP